MVLESYFLETTGLWALLAAVPLIILYLIRPKPQERNIPSLMFFMRDLGNADKRSFFRRFAKDWLFWLQLLALILLALAIAKPFMNVPESSLAKSTVIVLDVSASMQTDAGGETRFEMARDEALDRLSNVNTIILAKNIPLIAKQEVDDNEAREFLETVEAAETSTAIYDAARSTLDYANEDTRIVVISDFLETEVDNDVNTVKRALRAKGSIVEFIDVGGEANNVGIVDLVVKDDSTSVQVRNYNQQTVEVPISVGNIRETLSLEAGAADVFTFSTPTGVSNLEIDYEDDFALDNKAFISTPKKTRLRVLVITNDDNIETSNIWVALQAINEKTNYELTFETSVPPRSVQVNHDLIVLKDFDQNRILPGIFKDIQESVEEGAALIITPQRGMFNFAPLGELLPVTFEEEVKSGADIAIAEPEIESLTEDVSFGSVDYYFNTRPNDGVRAVATSQRDNGTIIAYRKRGAGGIIYYGIFDSDITVDGEVRRSTFKNDLFYPIFWKRTLDLLTDTPSVESLNRRTGRVLNLPQGQEIETPTGTMTSGVFMMDRQGIYTFKGQDIAANLLHAGESDVGGQFTEKEVEEVGEELVERERPKPLTEWFIIAGLVLLLLELVYTKFRGDM